MANLSGEHVVQRQYLKIYLYFNICLLHDYVEQNQVIIYYSYYADQIFFWLQNVLKWWSQADQPSVTFTFDVKSFRF